MRVYTFLSIFPIVILKAMKAMEWHEYFIIPLLRFFFQQEMHIYTFNLQNNLKD